MMREIQSLLIQLKGCVSGKNWWYFTVEQLKDFGELNFIHYEYC